MAQLEKFLHNQPSSTPALHKAALAHVQFETIHPFLDGNGRVGRLLIPMLLCVEGVLREPLLYLSLYLKQNKPQYYELLDRVRADGEWEEWTAFFARGVEETAVAAVATARRLLEISHADRARVEGVGRIAGSALRVHHALLSRPVNTIARLATETSLSVPTVTNSLEALSDLGLVREITGRKRSRVFSYAPYLEVLQQGM
jgi:Fic family protein